jgi:hypothetical protein
MQPGVKTLPVQQKAVAFTTSLTFREFLDLSPTLATFLQQRYDEVRLPLPAQTFFLTYPDVLNFIVLVNEESPDTWVVLPILVRIARSSPHFTLRILRDSDDLSMLATLAEELDLNENLAELDLPLLLIFDEEWEFQGQWGPHPQEAERYLEEWFERNPAYETLAEADTPVAQQNYAALLEELTHEMRVWYNTDLNYACAQEVQELLASLIEEGEPEEQNNG